MLKGTHLATDPAADAARDQLRSLAVQGYPVGWLADYMALSTNTLTRIRSGRARLMHARVAAEIAIAYLLLNGVDPAEHGVGSRGIHIAHLQAARGGWTKGGDPMTEPGGNWIP